MNGVLKAGTQVSGHPSQHHGLYDTGLCALFILILCLLLAVPFDPAHGFEVTSISKSGVSVPVVQVPRDGDDDACLYILKAAREQTGSEVSEHDYRQSAGSAVALGLVFGVKFALGPTELRKYPRRSHVQAAAFHVGEPRDYGGQALAVADYRACRNERTLRTLTD